VHLNVSISTIFLLWRDIASLIDSIRRGVRLAPKKPTMLLHQLKLI